MLGGVVADFFFSGTGTAFEFPFRIKSHSSLYSPPLLDQPFSLTRLSTKGDPIPIRRTSCYRASFWYRSLTSNADGLEPTFFLQPRPHPMSALNLFRPLHATFETVVWVDHLYF